MAGLAGRPGAPRLALGRSRCLARGAYGFIATLQPDADFGRILAASGGVFVIGALAWAMARDGFRPDDLTGAGVCLLGLAVIVFAPRGG